MAVNLGFGPLIGMNAPAVGMPQPRRSWQARLYDRLNPNQDQGLFGGISDDEKKALTRQGLLQLGIGLLQNNNFPQALGQGLQGGLLAMNEGAQDIQGRKYQQAMMQRTLAGAQRNTQIEALRGELSNPDGSINEAKFRQLAALDPESAKAYRDAVQPRVRFATGQITTPSGTLPYVYDQDNPFTQYDLRGQPLYGSQPQPDQQGGGLYDNVMAAVGPIGGRITSTTGGKHNAGSLHASGGAVDVGMGRESPEQQAAILAALQRDPSLKVVDERARPQGQAEWSGPHLHVERAGGSDPFAGRPGFVPAKPKDDVETFSQPQEVTDPATGKPVLVRFGNRGSVQPVTGYGAPQNSASANKEAMQQEKQVTSLSKRLTEENVPFIDTTLNTVEGMLRGYTDASGKVVKDIPGYGRLDSLKPDFAISPDGLDLRQTVAGLANTILKSRSGAAVTDNELRRFLQEAGTNKLMPEQQLLRGIGMIRKWFDAQKSNIKGGYSPEVVQTYYGNAPENTGLLESKQNRSAQKPVAPQKSARPALPPGFSWED